MITLGNKAELRFNKNKIYHAGDKPVAADIVFTDGKNFQQKLDDGSLKGQKGDAGLQGPKGNDGLTTSITVDGKNYIQASGKITLPNYPTLKSIGASPSEHDHNSVYETPSGAQTKANNAENNAKAHAEKKIADLVGGAPEQLDTLKELADSLQENQAGVSDLLHIVGTKASASDLTSHTGNATVHITSAERAAWNGMSSLALGETSSTAYRGDRGKIAYDHSQTSHNYAPSTGSSSISKLASTVTLGDGGIFTIDQNNGGWWQKLGTLDSSDKAVRRLYFSERQGIDDYVELFSVDGNGDIFAKSRKVYHTGNKPTPADIGALGSIVIGTTTTGNAGTNATVTATTSGTTSTLNFTIPRGNTGAQGEQGIQGLKGADGLTTKITVNGTAYTHSGGNITLPNYPTLSSLGAAASNHTDHTAVQVGGKVTMQFNSSTNSLDFVFA